MPFFDTREAGRAGTRPPARAHRRLGERRWQTAIEDVKTFFDKA
jgi:hypothetical protein